MAYTRREFAGLVAGALAVPARINAFAPRALELGIHTYSFHEIQQGGLPAVEQILSDTRQLGLSSVELFAPELEPMAMPTSFYQRWAAAAHGGAAAPPARPSPDELRARREAVRAWRMNPPQGYFAAVKEKFATAGIAIFALNYSFDSSMNEAEIDAGFEQAKALGTDIITSASTVSFAQHVVPFAEKHGLTVAFHNTTSDDPDRIVAPEAYDKILAMSKHYKINFDVAHYFAAGYDPVAFITRHHAQIVSMHIHDRKSHNGPSVANGDGETPLRDVLQLLRKNQWKIPLFYELEHVGSGMPIVDIRKDIDYLQKLAQA